MRIEALLDPKSVAIVGASERPSIGRAIIDSLHRLEFRGAILPVNPRYESVLGHTCYTSLAALPQAPDVVAVCVGHQRVLESFRQLPDAKAAAAVIYDGGFAERGEEGRNLQDEIAGICREAGIALCGPNCMGILNPTTGSSTYIQEVRHATGLAGNVGLISQSGSVCIGLLADVRRFGYSIVVSSGNEAVVSTAAYLEHLIDDPATKVIATFSETIREPERYIAALDRAAACNKPVVVLKVGRTERTRRAITSHTGGLAGESRVFSEVLRAHRAIEVNDLDELTEVLSVCQGTRWPTGRRIAVTTASGGQAELILDVATTCKLDLPPLSAPDRADVEQVIGSVTGDGNPLDAWGNGDYATNMPHAFSVLGSSEGNDVVVFCSDSADNQPMGRAERALDYVRIFAAAAGESSKPHYLMGMRSGVLNRDQIEFLKPLGIPVIGGTRQGLGAVDRLARYAQPLAPVCTAPQSIPRTLAAISNSRHTVNEFDSKRVLAAYGLPTVREVLTSSLSDAKSAARELGYPVALKLVSDDVPHKSEGGFLAIGLKDEDALNSAWEAITGRVAAATSPIHVAGYLVQQMINEGTEVFAGISRDPDFGLTLGVGQGGTEIEVIRDFSLRSLPLRQGDAETMIGETRQSLLLDGFRGRPAVDRPALVRCLEALADLASAEGDLIAEIDLNPIKVLPAGRGCVVLDALIVTRSKDGSERSG